MTRPGVLALAKLMKGAIREAELMSGEAWVRLALMAVAAAMTIVAVRHIVGRKP